MRSSLRDKIAKFEQRGGTPIPRGSFGMGAPPPQEDLSTRKKGEMLGNRIPGLNKPNGPPIAYSNTLSPTPSSRKRHVSTSGLQSDSFGEMSPELLSPPMSATTHTRSSTLGSADGDVESFHDSGFHSAASSRPSSMIFGRRAVSDSYGAYGMPSPAEVRDDEIQGTTEPSALESQKTEPITEVMQLCSEPEVIASPEPEKILEQAVLMMEPSITEVAVEEPVDALTLPIITEVPVPEAVVKEPTKESTSKSVGQARAAEVDLKIDLPPLEEPQEELLSSRPVLPISALSQASVETLMPKTAATMDSVLSVTESLSLAEIVTAHTENLTHSTKPVLMSAPTSAVPSPTELTVPSIPPTTQPESTPDVKPIGESAPRLRKKTVTAADAGPEFQELSLTPQPPSRKSFSAVVHKKNKDSTSSTKSSDSKVPAPLPISSARHKLPDFNAPVAPASPGAGELEWLAAEAAMLEKALGIDWSSNEEYSEPDYSVPLFTRSKPVANPTTPPVPELVHDDASSEQTDATPSTYSGPYPVPTVREVSEDGEDEFNSSAPAKSLRSRKLSSRIKTLASTSTSTLRSFSTSSRPSMSSEMSSEDSRRSPSASREDVGYLGGSVGSRWTPSPKKTALSRATSFADRLMNRASKTKSTFLDEPIGQYYHLCWFCRVCQR